MNVKVQCQKCSAAIENWDNIACNLKKNHKRIFVSESNCLCLYLQKHENLHMLLFPQLSSRQTAKLQTGWVVSAVGNNSGHGPHSEGGDQWFLLRLAVCHKWVPQETSSEIKWTALKAASPGLLMRKLVAEWTCQKGEQELDEV